MILKIKQTCNNNKWTAFHNQWGTASGRISTLLWDTKQDVEKWIKENKPSSGFYRAIPYILPQDLVDTEVSEE